MLNRSKSPMPSNGSAPTATTEKNCPNDTRVVYAYIASSTQARMPAQRATRSAVSRSKYVPRNPVRFSVGRFMFAPRAGLPFYQIFPILHEIVPPEPSGVQFCPGETMQTSKPFEIIAARFQVSNESAKYFLIRVQKSF